MAYEVSKYHWRYDTFKYAWKRACTESQRRGLAHAVFRTGDCYYVMCCDGVPDYFYKVIEDIIDGEFVQQTTILR